MKGLAKSLRRMHNARALSQGPRKAERLEDYDGKRVYRFPVLIRCNDSTACATVAEITTHVTAHKATEAANYIAERCGRPETEIMAFGPQGGQVYRYVGWFSAIGRGLNIVNRNQLCLF